MYSFIYFFRGIGGGRKQEYTNVPTRKGSKARELKKTEWKKTWETNEALNFKIFLQPS
jgi:hypothetical protein